MIMEWSNCGKVSKKERERFLRRDVSPTELMLAGNCFFQLLANKGVFTFPFTKNLN